MENIKYPKANEPDSAIYICEWWAAVLCFIAQKDIFLFSLVVPTCIFKNKNHYLKQNHSLMPGATYLGGGGRFVFFLFCVLCCPMTSIYSPCMGRLRNDVIFIKLSSFGDAFMSSAHG